LALADQLPFEPSLELVSFNLSEANHPDLVPLFCHPLAVYNQSHTVLIKSQIIPVFNYPVATDFCAN
jgi:hypothetical protein